MCGSVTGYVEDKCRHELVDSHGVSKLSTAGAIQINKHDTNSTNDDWCYVVGYYNEAATKLKLINERDPTEGLQVTYLGDFCNGGTQRKFHVMLECSDKLNPVPTHAYELTGCEYTVYMPSVYGCPLECPVANRQLCGGNGHCAYDEDKGGARCFCNHGSYGDDCSVNSQTEEAMSASHYSPAMTGLIVTLFIVIALLVVGIYVMFKQVSAYKDDVTNYQVLKGGDEIDGNSTRSGGSMGNNTMHNPIQHGRGGGGQGGGGGSTYNSPHPIASSGGYISPNMPGGSRSSGNSVEL